MKKILFVLLFYCSIIFGQIDLNGGSRQGLIEMADSSCYIYINKNYINPYKTLAGSAYNDSLIAIYENYPSGNIEIQFGDETKPLDSLSNDKLIKTVKFIFKKWNEQIRKKDEEYFELYYALVEMRNLLSGKI